MPYLKDLREQLNNYENKTEITFTDLKKQLK